MRYSPGPSPFGRPEDGLEIGDGLAPEPVGVGEPVRAAGDPAAPVEGGELDGAERGLGESGQPVEVDHLLEQRSGGHLGPAARAGGAYGDE